MKYLAVIPARGGSKGIPKKNLIEIANKPLIGWTIEAGITSKYIDMLVVSSDDVDILDYANTFKGVNVIERPKELAEDHTPTVPVLIHALETLNLKVNDYDVLVLLQPTSPLRDSTDIDLAISAFENTDASALISVTSPAHHPLKSFKVNDEGYLNGIINNEYPFTPRQELPKVYHPNGAIYIVKISELLKNKSLFTNKTIPYIMSPEKSIDVDTHEDIIRIENQLNKT